MRTDFDNPYVGLRPFDVDESLLFFGRNDQTMELLQRLHDHHFVAVVGSSGCGKSSLLRAGLIPALKAGYLVDDSDHWFIAIMKPGQSPLYNLAESLLNQVNSATDSATIAALVQKIKEEGAGVILDLIHPLKKERNINFFLLVDQFEELFRFSMDQKDIAKKDEAIDFVNIMLELSQQSLIPFYVVITMRSDFIGDCAQFFGLPEAMNQSQYLVPRLNRVQLKTVIEGPAKLFGGKLNPSLISRLLNELGKVKDELPLLQHALMRMWDFEVNVHKSGEVDLQDYESIGGIEKALSNHADEALKGMTGQELNLTKEIFQALTAIDESGRKIRRPVLISQLKELTGATEEQLLNIIDLFIKDRRSFLVINKAGDTGDKVIDISHESLIRQWNKLSDWVDEEGVAADSYLQLAGSAILFKKKKKDYLEGIELQLALEWRNGFKPGEVWANRYKEGFKEYMDYLNKSEQLNVEKEKQRIADEEKEANRLKEEEEREKNEKSRKFRQRVLIGGLVFLSLVITGTFYSLLTIRNQNKELKASLEVKRENEELSKKAREDSLEIRVKSMASYGMSQDKINALSDSGLKTIQEINTQIDLLKSKIDTSLTIQYFPKLDDEDKAFLGLKDLGYKLVIKETKRNMADIPTSCIWFSSDIADKPENLKMVALYLMRAGIGIKAIRQFHDDRDRSKLIQVGADKEYRNRRDLTLEEIITAPKFDRIGIVQ